MKKLLLFIAIISLVSNAKAQDTTNIYNVTLPAYLVLLSTTGYNTSGDSARINTYNRVVALSQNVQTITASTTFTLSSVPTVTLANMYSAIMSSQYGNLISTPFKNALATYRTNSNYLNTLCTSAESANNSITNLITTVLQIFHQVRGY
jgi:hypothetical protein